MYKIIVLTKRKPGMSMADFIDYYENGHAVLMRKLYPQLRRYVRTYLTPVSHEMTAAGEMPYDCMTEAYFDDEAGYRDVLRQMEAEPEKTAAHLKDEENLFDRSKIGWFTTQTCETRF